MKMVLRMIFSSIKQHKKKRLRTEYLKLKITQFSNYHFQVLLYYYELIIDLLYYFFNKLFAKVIFKPTAH